MNDTIARYRARCHQRSTEDLKRGLDRLKSRYSELLEAKANPGVLSVYANLIRQREQTLLGRI